MKFNIKEIIHFILKCRGLDEMARTKRAGAFLTEQEINAQCHRRSCIITEPTVPPIHEGKSQPQIAGYSLLLVVFCSEFKSVYIYIERERIF